MVLRVRFRTPRSTSYTIRVYTLWRGEKCSFCLSFALSRHKYCTSSTTDPCDTIRRIAAPRGFNADGLPPIPRPGPYDHGQQKERPAASSDCNDNAAAPPGNGRQHEGAQVTLRSGPYSEEDMVSTEHCFDKNTAGCSQNCAWAPGRRMGEPRRQVYPSGDQRPVGALAQYRRETNQGPPSVGATARPIKKTPKDEGVSVSRECVQKAIR